VKICREIPYVVKKGKKYLALLHADVSTSCCQERKVAMKALSSSELL